jgi:NADP-dependent 3-hydroxy acid dehydrogenase YdfG
MENEELSWTLVSSTRFQSRAEQKGGIYMAGLVAGKVAVVMGGGSGMGRAAALTFARATGDE